MRDQILAVVFGVLSVVCIGVILYINTANLSVSASSASSALSKGEGFADASAKAKKPTAKQSAIETQIRTVLDRFVTEEAVGPQLCAIYTYMRSRNALNIQARANSAAMNTSANGDAISEAEVQKQVEADFAIGIPGGALQCPLLTYPTPGSTDADWLDFVNKLPPDFLARILYMASYAQATLGKQASDLRSSLEGVMGKMNTISPNAEGFASVCPPSLHESRRLEKLGRANPTCSLPEDMSPKEIQESVTAVLQQLVSQEIMAIRAIQLKQSGASSVATAIITDILPPYDLKATIADAATSMAYLKKQHQAAMKGELVPTS